MVLQRLCERLQHLTTRLRLLPNRYLACEQEDGRVVLHQSHSKPVNRAITLDRCPLKAAPCVPQPCAQSQQIGISSRHVEAAIGGQATQRPGNGQVHMTVAGLGDLQSITVHKAPWFTQPPLRHTAQRYGLCRFNSAKAAGSCTNRVCSTDEHDPRITVGKGVVLASGLYGAFDPEGNLDNYGIKAEAKGQAAGRCTAWMQIMFAAALNLDPESVSLPVFRHRNRR